LSARKQIFVKDSAVLKKPNGVLNTNSKSDFAHLDERWEVYRENRMVYGSDWLGAYYQVLKVEQENMTTKPGAVSEKYFYKNPRTAYSWKRHDGPFESPTISRKGDRRRAVKLRSNPNRFKSVQKE